MEAQGWVLLRAPKNQTQISTGPRILGGERLLWVLHNWVCGQIGVVSQVTCPALTAGGHAKQRVQIQAGENSSSPHAFWGSSASFVPSSGRTGKKKKKKEGAKAKAAE